ncbi:MAG: RNA methyltransferase [Methanomicrobiales archaeon]|nr:RNA methyltransferase [Methanomicrobiales archaeon]
MPEIEIVLVGALYQGNVGYTARAMKNFGFTRLVLVDACEIGDEARIAASHATDVLEHARRCSFEQVHRESSLTIATTGAVNMTVCKPMRMPYYTPREVREIVSDLGGRVSILFGRENWGLNNEEVEQCDIVCTIPAAAEYPILNLSHAVAIVCYELANLSRGTYPLASHQEMDCLYAHLNDFLDRIEHPSFKRRRTMLLLRRILGRTKLTTREVSTLHGLLRRTEWHIARGEERAEECMAP